MGEKRFSDEQLSAIEERSKTLLVSAAAGSGKTTTLTERIIRSILDEGRCESIADMLIVTFTNASVADLREKISKAIKEAIKENPENKRLERELHILPSARICTIDSFCNEILRSSAEKVGVMPNYRIAESAEAEILSVALLDALINSAYEGEIEELASLEEVEELFDCLTSSKQTKNLAQTLLFLYNKSKSSIEGIECFQNLANNYLQNPDFSVEESVYGAYAIEKLRSATEHYANLLSTIGKELMLGEGSELAYMQTLENDRDILLSLREKRSYEDIKEWLSLLSFGNLPTVKGEKTHAQLTARDARNSMKEDIDKLAKRFFSYSKEEWQELYKNMYRVLNNLAIFLRKFDTVYSFDKKKRGMLEHSDVERYTYMCLYRNGELTDVARAYRDRFSSVYIDEYQDVNALQDAIFAAVSRDNNRFMVGDIKQSIYGFRSAKPEIFKKMKEEFLPLEKSEGSENATVFMSNNYRCDKGIIDFVNEVFDTAFGYCKESIGYTEKDSLNFAKIYPNGKIPQIKPVEIFVKLKEDEDESAEKLDTAPDWVAKKIKELLDGGTLADGSAIKPSDIAIIMRKRAKIADFSAALLRVGVKSDTKDDRSFFLNSEILLALCLLNSIDNPKKDIYLAGLMCSPLYGFTADELLKIKKPSRAPYLYDALCEYSAANPDDKKAADFLHTMYHYRMIAEGVGVDVLIARLYRETGLLALASRHGGKDNLLLLYNYARKYESSSFNGLHNFITYVNNIIDSEASFANMQEEAGDDAVKILTIHSSKGLEFPIVFLVDASAQLINLDARNRIAYSEDFGLSVCLRDPSGIALVNNPAEEIIRDHMNKKYFEEELRVLYVALTRAKESLYVIGSTKESEKEEYLEKVELTKNTLTEYSQRKLKSYLDIITACQSSAKISFIDTIPNKTTDAEENNEVDVSEKSDTLYPPNEKKKDELIEKFKFRYPKNELTEIPEKLSVSILHPAVLDGSDDNAVLKFDEESASDEKRAVLPSFITGTSADESAKRGIATHTFLQFCDFDLLLKDGVDAELKRLVKEQFISQEDERRVRKNEIDGFIRSHLFDKLRSAKKLYREFRFNSRLPAENFTSQEEKKSAYKNVDLLVQGVIDCIIEDENGDIHLVDYKTDRLPREALADKCIAEKIMREKHSLQLSYYALAAEKIFGKAPKTLSVYSLALGDTIEIL